MVNITDKVSNNEDSISTNIPASLGTAGQVLTVNSGATAGEWADAGGGAWNLVDEVTDLDAWPNLSDDDWPVAP